MSGDRAKSGKKNRKIGRNKRFCEKYTREGRREKNRIIKQKRHAKAVAHKRAQQARRHDLQASQPGG